MVKPSKRKTTFLVMGKRDEEVSLGDDSDFLFALNIKDQTVRQKEIVGGVEFEVLIDLGATFNILDRQWWEFVKENAVKCKC